MDQAPSATVGEGAATADASVTPEGGAEGLAAAVRSAAGTTTTGEDVAVETAAPVVPQAFEADTAAGLEVPQLDTEAAAVRANEVRVAAAADPTLTAASGEVVTQTVSAEDVRSSAEAFEVDDAGLSDLEREFLIGLGTATVGAILGDGGRVVENTGDRVVVDRGGEFVVLKNDDVLLFQPGATVSTRRYEDGSTLTVVQRENGVQVTTIRAANGQVLRRTRMLPDGTTFVLFDDTREVEPVEAAEIQEYRGLAAEPQPLDDLRLALAELDSPELDRSFTLQQVRELRAVRELQPQIDVEAIEFDSGSAVIEPTEAEALRDVGVVMAELVEQYPGEVFLVEGHTDAVGDAAMNLALSDRRAESVALALTEYFDVPPESMIVQGYGEANLKVPTTEAERENRRASVRRITPLLQGAGLQ